MPLETRMIELERRLGILESSHDLLIRLDSRVDGIRDDINDIKRLQAMQDAAIDGERKARQDQREADRKQSRADRFLLIGTIIASSSCIIGAVGLIVGNLP